MSATPELVWATEADTVLKNFEKLINQAQNWTEPQAPNDFSYRYWRAQLACRILFYTASILTRGTRLTMEGNTPRLVYQVVKDTYKLQQKIVELKWLPEDLQELKWRSDGPGILCSNPLVPFLKMAIQTGMYVLLSDIQELIKSLNFMNNRATNKRGAVSTYCPGMPGCVMVLLSPDHDAVVSASKDQYRDNDLETASDKLWESQLTKLRDCYSSTNKSHVERLESLSNDFFEVAKRLVQKKTGLVNIEDAELTEFVTKRVSDPSQKRINLNVHERSCLATWKPNGDEYPACLLDYYRFDMKSANTERRILQVYGTKTCAEWAGFIHLASREQEFTLSPLLTNLA